LPRWWRPWDSATSSPTGWLGNEPVAGCCWWHGTTAARSATCSWSASPAAEPEVRRWLPGVPRLDHLEVLGPLQGRGIGTALIGAGEDTARQLGHQQLALGVGLDNPKARQLYERLGYADWGHGTVVGTWVERDHDGPPVTLSETCDMLVKRL
jgi:GNAT superfamily N-acetyltransferase